MKTIVLPELGSDERVDAAAHALGDNSDVLILDLNSLAQDQVAHCAQHLGTKKKYSSYTEAELNKALENSLLLGAVCVDVGYADGMVAGAVHPTADVLRAGLHVIGSSSGVSKVSSCFWMRFEDREDVFFADCAVNPEPDDQTLAVIARSTADTARRLGFEPRVALLSASTKGSASYQKSDLVQSAAELLRAQEPDFVFDGEIQLDAALVPSIAQHKGLAAPFSEAPANVFIFPDIDSGNIGYKLVERFAGAQAVGPILQGFAKPINDLSRGCSVDDIVELIKITLHQMPLSNEDE